MKIKNISKRKYIHYLGKDEQGKNLFAEISAKETKDIPDAVAEIWLKTGDIVKVDDGSKDKEIARLKAENEKLKAQSKCAEGNANDQSEKTGDDSLKEELLEKCKALGIRVTNPNTKIETLQNKIAEAEKKLADKTAE